MLASSHRSYLNCTHQWAVGRGNPALTSTQHWRAAPWCCRIRPSTQHWRAAPHCCRIRLSTQHWRAAPQCCGAVSGSTDQYRALDGSSPLLKGCKQQHWIHWLWPCGALLPYVPSHTETSEICLILQFYWKHPGPPDSLQVSVRYGSPPPRQVEIS